NYHNIRNVNTSTLAHSYHCRNNDFNDSTCIRSPSISFSCDSSPRFQISSVASSDVVAAAYHLPSTAIGDALGSTLLISLTTVMNAV
ncbi:hypothetical protein, partial [Bacillus toyonensis]|uniref:hypothetical protein n=1 Tax=Bacillus toyonensis TaxID=155322 RepID=UPI001C55670A